MSGTNVTDSYTLKIVDQILSPLNNILKQAEKVNATLERMENLTSKGLGFAKMAAGVGVAVVGLMTLKGALEGVLTVLEKAAEGTLHFGKAVVDAVAFREKYRTMLQHQLGGKAGAHAYNKVMDIAELTPGTAAESMENAARFVNIGMRGNMLDAAIAGSMDVQAMFGAEKAAMFSRGITDMFSKPKFELQDFKQAVAGIVPAEVAAQQILRMKGITVAADKAMAKLDELHKAGKITGKEGAVGTMAALEQHADKGEGLGAFARKRGVGSLEGLLSNLMEAPANFLRRMDELDDSPGMKALKDFLNRVLLFFKQGTKEADTLKRVVLDMTNTLFGGLQKITQEDLGRFFESGVKMAGRLVDMVKTAWDWIDKLLHGDTGAFAKATAGVLLDIGKFIGQGIWEGFKNAFMPSGSSKKGQDLLSGGQLGAGGAELGLMAMKAGELTPDIIKKAGGAESPLFKAMINYLGGQGGLPVELQRQVETAQERFGMAHRINQNPDVQAVLEGAGEQEEAYQKIMERGEEYPKAVREGMDRASQRHSPPRLFVEAGEEYAEAILLGLRRRAEEVRDGSGEVDPFLDQLLEAMRGVNHRQGAAP